MKSSKPKSPDPILSAVLNLISSKTPREIAEASNNQISTSTIRSWRANKVRRPLNYTLDAALEAVGLERVIRKIRR